MSDQMDSVYEALRFFRSVIKCGERWTIMCEEMLTKALDELDAAKPEPADDSTACDMCGWAIALISNVDGGTVIENNSQTGEWKQGARRWLNEIVARHKEQEEPAAGSAFDRTWDKIHGSKPAEDAPKGDPGKTHYVGDDCPGGHRDDAPQDTAYFYYSADEDDAMREVE